MKYKVSLAGKMFPFAGLLFLFTLSPLFAGFNENLDAVLEQEQMTAGAAAYLILVSREEIPDESDFTDAAQVMAERFPDRLDFASDKPLTLGEYSLMLMLSYYMKGGLFYTITRIPRYALTEMRFKGYLKGRAYARMAVSGERGVRILGRVLAKNEKKSEGGAE